MEERVTRLEADMIDVKSSLGRMEPMLVAIGAGLQRLDERVQRLDDRVSRLDDRVERLDGRVGQLDGSVQELKVSVHKLELDGAELRGRVSQLPTTITLIAFVIAVLAAGGFMKHFFP